MDQGDAQELALKIIAAGVVLGITSISVRRAPPERVRRVVWIAALALGLVLLLLGGLYALYAFSPTAGR